VVRACRLPGRGKVPASQRDEERNQRQGPNHLERLYYGRVPGPSLGVFWGHFWQGFWAGWRRFGAEKSI
jgi:hypothetical protein